MAWDASRWIRWFMASCMVGALGGCSLALNTDASQCNSDADCQSLASSLPGAVCGADHVCQNGEQARCTSNQMCALRKPGEPIICTKHTRRCVPLRTDACTQVLNEEFLAEDDTIVLGFVAPLQGTARNAGEPLAKGVELALAEIESTANGLPGLSGSQGGRTHMAVVLCHELDDPVGVARHLSVQAGLPAIIGPAYSGILIDVATEITIPQGTMLMSPAATSPSLTDLSDNGLVWRTTPSDVIQAIPLSYLISDREALIRKQLNIPAGEDIRVAALEKGDAYGIGLADAVVAQATFNQKNVTQNGKNFLRLRYTDPAQGTPDYQAAAQQLLDFKPHIVLLLGTTETISDVVPKVEDGWAAAVGGGAGGQAPPHYLVPDGGRQQNLLDLVTARPVLAPRITGTTPGGFSPGYEAFSSRFKSAFGQPPLTQAESAYDALYLIAYSAVAGGSPDVTGASLAQGMSKLVSGDSSAFGPSDMNAAFNKLTAGGSLNVDGASGPLDFDLATGDAPASIDIWCVDATSSPAEYARSGLMYNVASAKVEPTGSPIAPCWVTQ